MVSELSLKNREHFWEESNFHDAWGVRKEINSIQAQV